MTTVQSDTRISWNQGRIVGPKPPLRPKHIWAIRTHLQHDGRVRDLAMFNVAIDCKLLGCELVKLRVADVHLGDSVRLRTTVIQQKTGRPVSFELTDPTREALAAWLKKRGLLSVDWLFPSRSHVGDHVTTRQYSRLVDDWVTLAGLDPAAYGTHSLRRTKVALVYKRTGNLRACQLLLGHTKLESTVRYLGIEVEDALVLSEQRISEPRAAAARAASIGRDGWRAARPVSDQIRSKQPFALWLRLAERKGLLRGE